MRDDINKLPLPHEAKAYARRSGMRTLKRQPQQFINMVAAVTDQKDKKHGFKNSDEVGRVPSAIKESAARIVRFLIEDDDDPEDFAVWKFAEEPDGAKDIYAIEVPVYFAGGFHRYANYVYIQKPYTEQDLIRAVEERMRILAKTRDFPAGSFFNAPWATYMIHGKRIGKL